MHTVCTQSISENPQAIALQQSFFHIVKRSLMSAGMFTALFWILVFTVKTPYRALKEEDKKKKKMKIYLHISYLLSYLHGPVVTLAGLYYLHVNGVQYGCESHTNEMWVLYVIFRLSLILFNSEIALYGVLHERLPLGLRLRIQRLHDACAPLPLHSILRDHLPYVRTPPNRYLQRFWNKRDDAGPLGGRADQPSPCHSRSHARSRIFRSSRPASSCRFRRLVHHPKSLLRSSATIHQLPLSPAYHH